MVGKSTGTEKDLQGIEREHSVEHSLLKAGQNKNCACDPLQRLAHPSQNHVSPISEWDWLLENGIWSTEPGWKQLLVLKRQLEGIEVRSSITGNICKRSLGHHRSKWSLLNSVQWVGLPLQPPSPSAHFCFCLHWEGQTIWVILSTLQAKDSSAHISSGVLSIAPAKASSGISLRHSCLRWDFANTDRVWVLKCGVKRVDLRRRPLLVLICFFLCLFFALFVLCLFLCFCLFGFVLSFVLCLICKLGCMCVHCCCCLFLFLLFVLSFLYLFPFPFFPFILWPCCTACGRLVTWPGINPGPPGWEHWVQDTGPSETSWA